MGISDWFKRFKRNAGALEEYREGVAGPQGAESQAERASRDRAQAPPKNASDREESRDGNA
jgi:hypothetical protein